MMKPQHPDWYAHDALDGGQQPVPDDVCPNCPCTWHGLPHLKGNTCPCRGALQEGARVVDLRKRRMVDEAALERIFGPRYRRAG